MRQKSRVKSVLAIALGLMFLASLSAAYAGTYTTPQRGSPERKAIMNALRIPVQKVLGQKVVFVVDILNVGEGWAFLFGRPQQPSGKKIDYRNTPYAEDVKIGMFDDSISALLRNKGSGWRVVTYDIGATDVVWETWAEDYGAPGELFAH